MLILFLSLNRFGSRTVVQNGVRRSVTWSVPICSTSQGDWKRSVDTTEECLSHHTRSQATHLLLPPVPAPNTLVPLTCTPNRGTGTSLTTPCPLIRRAARPHQRPGTDSSTQNSPRAPTPVSSRIFWAMESRRSCSVPCLSRPGLLCTVQLHLRSLMMQRLPIYRDVMPIYRDVMSIYRDVMSIKRQVMPIYGGVRKFFIVLNFKFLDCYYKL